MGVKLGVSS